MCIFCAKVFDKKLHTFYLFKTPYLYCDFFVENFVQKSCPQAPYFFAHPFNREKSKLPTLPSRCKWAVQMEKNTFSTFSTDTTTTTTTT